MHLLHTLSHWGRVFCKLLQFYISLLINLFFFIDQSLYIIHFSLTAAAMAKKAASLGVDGILVSAHGGRQLDGVPAPVGDLNLMGLGRK